MEQSFKLQCNISTEKEEANSRININIYIYQKYNSKT